MGIYAEYLDRHLNFPDLSAERKRQLSRISQLRGGNDIFCYAADVMKQTPLVAIGYPDLLPIKDQLANLSGKAVDVILETPGGSAEITEDIVKLLRHKYQRVAFIVPGMAKSAGTIMTMSGDEILMDNGSSLGPIDAQISWQGKQFSAHAFLEGLNKIKEEVDTKGSLNRAYVPMLQNISPGEIQFCENALEFSKSLVTDWLNTYKFRTWTKHSKSGAPVTEQERHTLARKIAEELCNQKTWLTHPRSVKIEDLEKLGLRITDYSQNADLYDAIQRYQTLLQMIFDGTNIYKIFETPTSQIVRFLLPAGAPTTKEQLFAITELRCTNCQHVSKIQANFDDGIPLEPSTHPFPPDDKFTCPNCKSQIDVKALRLQLESQSKKRILS